VKAPSGAFFFAFRHIERPNNQLIPAFLIRSVTHPHNPIQTEPFVCSGTGCVPVFSVQRFSDRFPIRHRD
jgi:hypothetical protein